MKTPQSEATPTSTLGAGQTRQISPINEQNGAAPTLISYPARPIQGGKLERAPEKTGLWFAEPKYNGWRALVHCPSGAMWNRHGGRLSISGEFGAALRELRNLSERGLVWADCEAMGRRHKIGCGTLIVLDWIAEDGSSVYEERRKFLEGLVPLERMSLGDEPTIPANSPPLAGQMGQIPVSRSNAHFTVFKATDVMGRMLSIIFLHASFP